MSVNVTVVQAAPSRSGSAITSTPISPVTTLEGAVGDRAGDGRTVRVLTLCTGNAARSVMAGAMLSRASLRIVTAGTHVVEGQPMSRRTRDALASVGLRADGHRSHQLTERDVEDADLILAMAGDHVAYIRRLHPEAASKTASIKRLCRDLPPALRHCRNVWPPWTWRLSPSRPGRTWKTLPEARMRTYLSCAQELSGLCAELLPRLT